MWQKVLYLIRVLAVNITGIVSEFEAAFVVKYGELCCWKTNENIGIKLLKRNVAFSGVHTAEVFAGHAKVGYSFHTFSIAQRLAVVAGNEHILRQSWSGGEEVTLQAMEIG